MSGMGTPSREELDAIVQKVRETRKAKEAAGMTVLPIEGTASIHPLPGDVQALMPEPRPHKSNV